MATIEDLFPELLLKVFSHYVRSEGHMAFLRNIPRVCKHWNELSSDSSLWRDVRAHNSDHLLHLSLRGLLYNTQSLKVYWCAKNYSDTNLSDVLKNIRDLKALDLSHNTARSDAIMVLTEHCPHLERLHLWISKHIDAMCHEWNRFLTVCGPTLKHLDLRFYGSRETGQQLVSGMAAKCPLLEKLRISFNGAPFPIHEFRSLCPRLKELEFCDFQLITAERDESLGCCGFRDLKKFRAIYSDFGGVDVGTLLKDSMDLEILELYDNDNLVFDNTCKIPSEKVKVLRIMLRDPDKNLQTLERAVFKWRHTLLGLELHILECNISCVLKCIFRDNPNPQLKSFVTDNNVDSYFLEEFIQKCQNLIHLKVDHKEYEGREEIERSFGMSHESKT